MAVGFSLDEVAPAAAKGFSLDEVKPVGPSTQEGSPPPSFRQRFEDTARDVIAASPLGPAVEIAKSFDPDLENSIPRALASVPESARKVLESTYHAIRHPIDTATGIGKLAAAFVAHTEDPDMRAALSQASPETQKAFAEAMDARKVETKPILDAALKGIADRYGGYDAIKHTFETDPVGLAMDASILAPVASPLNAGARVAGKATELAGRVAEPVVSHTLGFTTGAGADSVRTAARAGMEGGATQEALLRQMRGAGDMNEPVKLAQSAVGEMRGERGAAYREKMKLLGEDTKPLDLEPIEKAIEEASKVGSYKGVPLSNQVAETQHLITELFKKWKGLDPAEFHTAEGLDALKQAVNEIRMDTLQGTRSRLVAQQVHDAVKAQIIEQAPVYAETMGDYQKASEGINEATKTMSLGEKATQETALRKLQSTMRDTVASNFGGRKQIGEELAKHEPTLPAALAGQVLSSPYPRGLTARGIAGGELLAHGAAAAAALPLSSPRLVGEGAHLAGQMSRMVSDAWNAAGAVVGGSTGPLYEAGKLDEEMRKVPLVNRTAP